MQPEALEFPLGFRSHVEQVAVHQLPFTHSSTLVPSNSTMAPGGGLAPSVGDRRWTFFISKEASSVTFQNIAAWPRKTSSWMVP